MASADDDGRREKFVHHVRFFDAATRYPAPYVGFTGRPGHRFEHHCLPYDDAGFLNERAPSPAREPGEIRVFVVGDSTLLSGTEPWDTVPARIEALLRAGHSDRVRVYNFGAVSSCTEQMCALIWMRLLDLEPDALIVLSGATDAFQPFTFDPRPGYPYNAFISEYLYAHFFDETNDKSWQSGLDYDALTNAAFDLRTRMREEIGFGSPAWEASVAAGYEAALRRLARTARAVGVPVFYFLEPIVVRKDPLDASERDKASPDALAYIARQYDRYAEALIRVGADGPANLHVFDASRALNGPDLGLFYDIVHYDRTGRGTVAAHVAERVLAHLAPSPEAPTEAGMWAGLVERARRAFRGVPAEVGARGG